MVLEALRPPRCRLIEWHQRRAAGDARHVDGRHAAAAEVAHSMCRVAADRCPAVGASMRPCGTMRACATISRARAIVTQAATTARS